MGLESAVLAPDKEDILHKHTNPFRRTLPQPNKLFAHEPSRHVSGRQCECFQGHMLEGSIIQRNAKEPSQHRTSVWRPQLGQLGLIRNMQYGGGRRSGVAKGGQTLSIVRN